MGLYHAATITPTKDEAIAGWLPSQPWAPTGDGVPAVVASYRFDDPEGDVGIEVFLVRHGGALVHVPLTYRSAPLDGADLVCLMQHSALGQRWVYDGVTDPVFVRLLAAVSLTGVGQVFGMVDFQGRWMVIPPLVRLTGGGGSTDRVFVDGFERQPDDGDRLVWRSDLFELQMARRPVPGEQPAIGLRAAWKDQDDPVVLSQVLAL